MYGAQYDGIMTLLKEIRDRLPAPGQPAPLVAGMPEPPIGASVTAPSGGIWCHGSNGWGLMRMDGDYSWDYVLHVSAPEPFTIQQRTPRVINFVLPDEPEIDTKWRDRDGDVWIRGTRGWGVCTHQGAEPWSYVAKRWSPLTEVIDE